MLKLAKFRTFLVKVLKSAEFARKREKCEKCGFYAPWRPSRFLACISNENGALFGPFLLKVAFGRKSALFSEKGGKWRFSHFWAEKGAFSRKGWNYVSIRWDHLAVDENYCPLPDPPSRVGRRPLRQPFSSFSSSPRDPFQRVRWGLASPPSLQQYHFAMNPPHALIPGISLRKD